MTEISILNSADTFVCDENDTILRAALRANVGMAYSCNVGSCGNCRFELVEGKVSHLREDAPAWSERDLKRNRWLACQARPTGPCTIKFRADGSYITPHPPKRRKARLTGQSDVTHDIREFRFEFEGEDGFLPGQYALLSLPGVAGARAYSMCNLPGEGNWSFQIKKVAGGASTGQLFSLKDGAEIAIDGPYSTAYLRPDRPRDIILMAGGSGLSPMVSIARGAAAAGLLEHRKLHFYYGCRAENDLIDASLLGGDIAGRISFTAALSDVPATQDRRSGFLHEVVEADFGERLKDHEIYFAGPPVMAAAIQKMAHEAGVPMNQLHFDEFY